MCSSRCGPLRLVLGQTYCPLATVSSHPRSFRRSGPPTSSYRVPGHFSLLVTYSSPTKPTPLVPVRCVRNPWTGRPRNKTSDTSLWMSKAKASGKQKSHPLWPPPLYVPLGGSQVVSSGSLSPTCEWRRQTRQDSQNIHHPVSWGLFELYSFDSVPTDPWTGPVSRPCTTLDLPWCGATSVPADRHTLSLRRLASSRVSLYPICPTPSSTP